ncbi:MAG: hypothetical protein ACI840_000738 [Ulvibacter sp.]
MLRLAYYKSEGRLRGIGNICALLSGIETDWVHTELKTIIETNLHQSSAGYKVRGKKVLAQITKFKHK